MLLDHARGCFLLLLLLLPKSIPWHCQPPFGYTGYQSLDNTAAGIALCGPYNMESPRSLRSCRIHNILTNVDTKRAHVTQSIREMWWQRWHFVIWTTYCGHCRIPQSCDVRIFPVVLPDVLNCCRAELDKQLVCLKCKHTGAFASKHQKAAPDSWWSGCQHSLCDNVPELTYQGPEYQDHDRSCNLRDEDQQDDDKKLGERAEC